MTLKPCLQPCYPALPDITGMSGLDSDFLSLITLAGLAPNAPDVVGPGGAALPHPVGAAHDAADADVDLEGLLALAPFVAPAVPKHEQRSWQHTERARAGKALKRAQQRTTLATAAKTSAESELRIVTALHGIGIASSSKPTPLIPEMASQNPCACMPAHHPRLPGTDFQAGSCIGHCCGQLRQHSRRCPAILVLASRVSHIV